MAVAIVRPLEWEWALLVHLLGAFLLVGAMVAVVIAALASTRAAEAEAAVVPARVGFRTLLFVVWPSFIVMRLAAEWVRSESGYPDEADWIGIGYIVSDAGLLVLLVLTLPGWLGLRRLRQGGLARPVTLRILAVLASVYLAALMVAIWAMTAKPG